MGCYQEGYEVMGILDRHSAQDQEDAMQASREFSEKPSDDTKEITILILFGITPFYF